jgi:hypothetical protein
MSISNLSPASQPVRKQRRPAIIDLVQSVPTDLGECISRDVKLLDKLGWHGLVAHRRPTGDFSSLTNVNHPARRLLKLYKYRGAPVKFATPPWTRQQILRALHRGPHKSCHDHISFLQGEFKDMMSRGQWLVLPYSAVKDLPGLRLSPPGVVPQRNRRPRWICDYSWWGINADTLPLAAKESMQFGHALDRILREILLADPTHGPVYLIKIDISDGFYRIALNIDDIPKLGVVFPTLPGEEPLVAFPLVLPMGWSNSPPIFSTATETIADLANERLTSNVDMPPHHLDDLAESILSTPPSCPMVTSPNFTCPLVTPPDLTSATSTSLLVAPPLLGPTRDPTSPNFTCPLVTPPDLTSATSTSLLVAPPLLGPTRDPTPILLVAPPLPGPTRDPTATSTSLLVAPPLLGPTREPKPTPILLVAPPLPGPTRDPTLSPVVTPPFLGLTRDPSLPTSQKPLAYADVFVDDFIGAAQDLDLNNRQRVRKALLHSIDDVFQPLLPNDNPTRQEPVSMKKLREGDCSFGTLKLILGWIIDTINMTIQLPQHRVDRLAEILNSIPATQRRTSVKKWYSILGELRSMALALPGSRNIFSTMQHALTNKAKGRIALNKEVHNALDDFRWMHNNIATRPTRIAEIIPLLPAAEGHHDASGIGAGGVWFLGDNIIPREGYVKGKPILWRYKWPQYIVDRLITDQNPNGTISNSDLELAGGLFQLDVISQCFDVRERTILSKGDNLSTTFWERNGSTTSIKPPAHLLRLFGIHQRIHRYVPRFDYISGSSNHVADALSRDFHLSWPDLILSLHRFLPQPDGCQLWTPSKNIVSAVISALLNKPSCRESLQGELPRPLQHGTSGLSSQLTWASTPFSKPSTTKYHSYKSLPHEFIQENLQPVAIPSGLDRLKITYGWLDRRSSTWGPTIPA